MTKNTERKAGSGDDGVTRRGSFEAKIDKLTSQANLQEMHITPRERAVLDTLAEGACNKSIAAGLGCSVRTVEFHLSNLLRKTGASSRLELVVWYSRRC